MYIYVAGKADTTNATFLNRSQSTFSSSSSDSKQLLRLSTQQITKDKRTKAYNGNISQTLAYQEIVKI